MSSSGNTTTTVWGIASDVLVPGDFDGDGVTDIAVFRPADQLWYVLGSSAGYYNFSWGLGSDVPLPADYDGDGKTDFAVWRPTTGTWYVLKSGSTGGTYIAQAWGNYNDQPVPADYDGDGKTDFAVWRPKTGGWHISKSSDNGYQTHTLGLQSDKIVEAAYLKQVGSSALDYTFARTRLAPKNATGGTNLYSQNFGWGSGLVGLPGRSGLSAGFGIGYNSLVWIKHNNAVVFDPDYSNAGAGFRFGFPEIEPVYYDGTLQKYAYMMVTPSGGRVEFRQTTASNIYETADSSYLQLETKGAANPNDPAENIGITIRGTDGTQMTYGFKGNSYKLSEIKDRNGNFITVNHDEYGLLRTVTDTLGRVITVMYDSDNYPINITRVWNGGNGEGAATVRTYATFVYTPKTVNPSFDGSLTIFGPQGLQVKVLDKLIFGDSTNNTGETRFEYNDFGQVKKVRNYAQDGHELNYTATNLETPGTNLTDVPRMTQTRSWVENFNVVGGTAQETVVNNTILNGQQTTDLDGATITATLIQVEMANHPHGNITNSYVGASGWMEGLPIRTDDYTANGTSLKRSSWTKWTQDEPSATLINNPRVVATKIGDDVSTKRTELTYKMQSGNVSDFGLVSEVRLYDAANNILLNKATTVYNENTAYLSRRIIGLPEQTEAYGVNQSNSVLEKVSKITYEYDAGNFSDTGLQQNIAPIQHDNTNYGASFIVGRANPTGTTRHDVAGQTSPVTSTVKYNTAGAPVASLDALGRQTKIIYEDKFNDNNNSRNTYAYPTKLIDAADNYSEVKYRFDIGANVWAKSPDPTGNGNGKNTTRIYDALGRLQKETLVNSISGAYTRYEYPTNNIQSKIFTTVIDTNSNGADSADEVYAESWSDGAGRVLRSRTEHPGSAGGWSGSLVEYDTLGRVKRSTVPTEISVSGNTWTPAGDDARYDAGNNLVWLWKSQVYDWKGRVIEDINTDGTKKLISYDGCGCAGGQTTTVSGEEIFETAWDNANPVSLGRRTQKIYADVLGRTKKTEILDWDNSVYSTTVAKFNGRDQAYSVTKYAGGENINNAHQETTISYDGFGRTKTQHRPEQVSANNTAAYTTYNYYADGNISTVVDARGATTNYTYNSRGLVDGISYAVPTGSTIPVTSAVTFIYDDAGNRTKMTDGLGTVDYTYTNLSQLKTEKRTFNDTLADAPAGGNAFLLSYDYTMSGQLKYITDPYGQQFNYAYDKVGRLQQVTGTTAFNGISTYANNPTYNARGTLTSLNYGNGVSMAVTGFNNKLQATGFEVKKGADKYIDKQYKFYEDGSLKFIDDALDEKFDRSYKYDFIGRTIEGKAGIAARGGTSTNQHRFDQPYTMQYAYDAFGHLTDKTGYYYSSEDINTYSYNAANRNPAWSYDADGNITTDADASYEYDAAGRIVKTGTRSYETGELSAYTADYSGGGGRLEKRTRNAAADGTGGTTNYYIRSSVLEKVISETNATGKKLKTFVPANGTTLATQEILSYNGAESLTFNHLDASGTGAQTTTANGTLSGNTTYARTGEYAPMGRNIADASPYINLTTSEPVEGGSGVTMFPAGAGYQPGQNTYTVDELVVPESAFMQIINSGYIGGAFGLMEIANRMSVRDYSVRFNDGNMQLERFFGSEGEAKNFAVRMNQTTVFKNILVSNAWSVLAAIATLAGRQDRQGNKQTSKSSQTSPLRKALNDFLAKNPDCLKLANEISKEKGLESFNKFAAGVAILDISKEPVLLDKTIKDLGGSGLPEATLNSTVRNLLTQEIDGLVGKYTQNAAALTVVNGNIVIANTPYIYNKKFSAGSILYHEVIFHALLATGGHSESLKEYTGETEASDTLANDKLTAWIEKGCPERK